ncbi:MAG: threonylcarbamoyl-AMP synthase [Synechococcales cyanobacterium RU_4_20]|nr:threonylcarbamoyl-AMP synthase [Synechococcales cyanobacterium RU_4_20]NJR67725.1 threonylcarbamoyl-AMP synthase [Synechococcales cyanobacterium CRU_2_2]
MAKIYELHPQNPQSRTIEQVVKQLRNGAVMLYPTDTVYAIGCDLNSKSAIQKVREIKQLSNEKPLTFLCPSLSNIADYAVVHDFAYKAMRRLIPGPYTFILPATKLVPKLVMSPKRKTTGIRVPDQAVCQTLLETLGNPLISTSANVADEEDDTEVFLSRYELFDALENQVDLILDQGEDCQARTSTMIDMTGSEPLILRQGLGYEAVAMFELAESID